MRRRWLPFALSLTLAAAGCSFAPRYAVPKSAEAPAAYRESSEWKVAQPGDQVSRGAWWNVFADPLLSDLEEQSERANQTLKAAFAASVTEYRPTRAGPGRHSYRPCRPLSQSFRHGVRDAHPGVPEFTLVHPGLPH